MKEGSVWIDHSTTDYGQNVEFQKQLDGKGAQMLEAPITGGMEALKKGEMAVWVAGDKATFEKVTITSKTCLNMSLLFPYLAFRTRAFWRQVTQQFCSQAA